MQGFFSIEETAAKQDITTKRQGCGTCKLYRNCITPRMETAGKGKKKILIIAEAPGEDEDRIGQPLVGLAGRLVKRTLTPFGIDLNRDCWKTNAVICRPPKNATPTDQQIAACRPHVFKEIERLKPRIIIVFGGVALKSLLQHRWLGDSVGVGGIERWRGLTIPDQELKCWICPIYHPSYVLRGDNYAPVIRKIFLDDIKNALECLKKEFPDRKNDESRLTILETQQEIDQECEKARLQAGMITFDFEGTGLRPQGEGHRIVSMSFAYDGHAYSFMMPRKKGRFYVNKLLACGVAKTGHNIQFENIWASVYLGIKIENWFWDSMLEAHHIENRKYGSSLKFQTYINFGIIDYESHMKKWLKAPPDRKAKYGANAHNKIMELIKTREGIRQLLKYGGFDSLYEHDLAVLQMNKRNIEVPESGVPF